MITISTDPGIVTMMNVITVSPENQRRLIETMIGVGESLKPVLPGLISVSLHRSTDGTRVVNYQQWRSREAFEDLQRRYADRMRPLLEIGAPDPHLYEIVYQYEPEPT